MMFYRSYVCVLFQMSTSCKLNTIDLDTPFVSCIKHIVTLYCPIGATIGHVNIAEEQAEPGDLDFHLPFLSQLLRIILIYGHLPAVLLRPSAIIYGVEDWMLLTKAPFLTSGPRTSETS